MKALIEILTPLNWKNVYSCGPRIVQQHKTTKNYRSSMYDMTYGCSYWVDGNHWMEEREDARED